jgi:hypothetical protein
MLAGLSDVGAAVTRDHDNDSDNDDDDDDE